MIKGTIEIYPNSGVITIRLENGSYALRQYPLGAKRFLEDEIEELKRPKRQLSPVDDQIMKMLGMD